jgi:hypothetical protein
MLGLLGKIVCLLANIPEAIINALVSVVNLLVGALALLAGALVALLPAFPQRTPLTGDWVAYMNWFLPVGSLLTVLSWALAAALVWLLVSTAFRWVKAL